MSIVSILDFIRAVLGFVAKFGSGHKSSIKRFYGQKLLLIVEDEHGFVKIVSRIAAEFGMIVVSIKDSEKFVETMTLHGPDIIFIDLKMPGQDGVELLHELSVMQSSSKIVIASGFDEVIIQSSVQIGKSLGLQIVGYLVKPVRVSEIRRLFQECLK